MNRKQLLFLEAFGLISIAFLIAFFADRRAIQSDPERRASADKDTSVEEPRARLGTIGHEAVASGKLTVFDPQKAYAGYTIFPVAGTSEVLLLDMHGRTVHYWPVDAERARLLPNGHLLVVHGSKWGKDRPPWNGLRDTLIEYDWNGKEVWRHKAKDVVHHEVRRLENGDTAFLRRTMLPDTYRDQIEDPIMRQMDIRSDSIVRINPAGETIWEWDAHEHFDLNSCGRRECRDLKNDERTAQKMRDWTHINTLQVIPPNPWYDAGDTRFKPGNYLILPRNWWTIYLVDHETGEIVWHYGGDYRGGISGGHEANMIAKGLPGEGNILVLDNGTKVHRGESFVLEINPTTNELVWVYDVGKAFWTGTRGLVQRLPNGNTLISEDNTGRVFEVTKSKEIVWEFKGDFQVSRGMRYPPDFAPQFATLEG